MSEQNAESVRDSDESAVVYVVIDVGCHECGVSSEGVGIYPDADAARAAAEQRDQETQCWRDGGQTSCEVFEMRLSASSPAQTDGSGTPEAES